MNILFIGPYRQSDGWGYAAQDYLMALNLTSHNIAARPIYMSNNINSHIPNEILSLENRILSGKPNVIIQNALPPLLDYQEGAKNIALLYVESNHLSHNGWISQLNLMDEVWVATSKERDILITSGVNIPIQIVHTPINSQKLIKTPTVSLDLPINPNNFVFYFIGEYNPRKNINALLMAFHREFYITEPVSLLLKFNHSKFKGNELSQLISNDLQNLKTAMRLHSQSYGYKQEIIISHTLSYNNIIQLHKFGDCLVQPSYGESLSRPVLEALGVGNPVIVTNNTGMVDAVPTTDYLCPARTEIALNAQPPLADIYTSYETISNIDVLALQMKMRQIFEIKTTRQQRNFHQRWIHNKFSHEAVANHINTIL
jgi:glycosyltransferase involved in cell wall biosynthesis